MLSLGHAVLLGFVLVIALAVAWYLYTTFSASSSVAAGQRGLKILQACVGGGQLLLRVEAVAGQPVYVDSVEIYGVRYPVGKEVSGIDEIVVSGIEASTTPLYVRVYTAGGFVVSTYAGRCS